jgi:hypothetical protein
MRFAPTTLDAKPALSCPSGLSAIAVSRATRAFRPWPFRVSPLEIIFGSFSETFCFLGASERVFQLHRPRGQKRALREDRRPCGMAPRPFESRIHCPMREGISNGSARPLCSGRVLRVTDGSYRSEPVIPHRRVVTQTAFFRSAANEPQE